MILGWIIYAIVLPYFAFQGQFEFQPNNYGGGILIQSVTRTEANVVTIWVQNIGDSDVVLSDVYVNDVLTDGSLGIELAPSAPWEITLSGTHPGLQIKIKVVTRDGTFDEWTNTFPNSTGSS